MDRLEGKVALVTGCGRYKGIGRAIALALARAGADVAVSDVEAVGRRNMTELDQIETSLDWKGLESMVAEISTLGRRAAAFTGDVGIKADAERLVADTVSRLGSLDILVNNAGAPHGADRNWTWIVPEEAFDDVMRINAKGAFLMSGAAVRHMLGRGAKGRIINIASGAGKRGFPQRAAYCASKFAVIGLTQSMAQELGDRGITVNAVCPGPIDTARQASRGGQAAAGSGTQTSFATPVPRLGVAADIAHAVLFLADPDSDFITGQSVNVDGGLLMS